MVKSEMKEAEKDINQIIVKYTDGTEEVKLNMQFANLTTQDLDVIFYGLGTFLNPNSLEEGNW